MGQALVLPIRSAADTCAYRRASFGDGSPALRSTGSPEERQGLPGYGVVLFVRAVIKHPAGPNPSSPLLLFEKIHGEVIVAFA